MTSSSQTSSSNETLDRIARRVPIPDLAYERMLQRRDRKRRNQRITAGVAGIAVFVAAILIVTTVGSFDRTRVPAGGGETGPTVTGPTETGPTYDGPSYTLGPVTQQDIALGESLMDAWQEGNGEAAAAMFAAEGTFDGFGPEILPPLHDWFRAEGWTFGSAACGVHGLDDERGVVGCGFTYENDLTRGLGLPPVDTGLSFVTDGGRIETAWYGSGGDAGGDMFDGYRGREDVLGPVWDAVIDWISSRHPEEFVDMYDPDRGYPILDRASIELWGRYTDEFVASPEAHALARTVLDAGWDGVGIPPEGTAPSTPEQGKVVAKYYQGYGPLFVYVYADGRVITQTRSFDFVTERRLTSEGVELVRSGAIPVSGMDRFLFSSDPVPAGLWEDSEIRPFVPSRYAVCYYQESGDSNPGTINGGYEYPSRVVGFFPAPARAILRGELTHGQVGRIDDRTSPECSGVTTDEARTLVDILSDVRVVDSEGDEISLEIRGILPHGVKLSGCDPCG